MAGDRLCQRFRPRQPLTPHDLQLVDSSSGFRLPDGSVLSPDASRGFAPLCPDLVVELASPSDDGPRTNGAQALDAGEILPGLRIELAEV